MGARKIKVTPQELKSAAKKISTLATTYETNYKSLYTAVNDMASSWTGKDNIAFTNQIKGFEDDFKKMKQLMDKYAEYLQKTGDTYQNTLNAIEADAKKLTN